MNKVLIGMCSGGVVQAQTVVSLLGLAGGNQTPAAFSLQIGGYKPHSLNRLVEEAKSLECTHLLSIDCDMIFPPDGLQRLLEADKDIVGALYRARGNHETQDTPYSVIKFLKGKEADVYKSVPEEDVPKTLFQCGAVGLGLTLIKMEVFDKLPFPYFRTTETPDQHSTEDIVFCQDAIKAGFEVWCDPTLSMGHLGQYTY
jgi:hypothetical protein